MGVGGEELPGLCTVSHSDPFRWPRVLQRSHRRGEGAATSLDGDAAAPVSQGGKLVAGKQHFRQPEHSVSSAFGQNRPEKMRWCSFTWRGPE